MPNHEQSGKFERRITEPSIYSGLTKKEQIKLMHLIADELCSIVSDAGGIIPTKDALLLAARGLDLDLASINSGFNLIRYHKRLKVSTDGQTISLP